MLCNSATLVCQAHMTEDNDLILKLLENWINGEQFCQRYGATAKLLGFSQKVKHLFQVWSNFNKHR